MEFPNSDHTELNHLFWKDEILQVLYWLYGEGLEAKVELDQLTSFLQIYQENLLPHLELLEKDGYVTSSNILEDRSRCFELTEFGRMEAGKRFSAAFRGMQKAGHGECGTDCDCQWEGKESCQHSVHHQNCNH